MTATKTPDKNKISMDCKTYNRMMYAPLDAKAQQVVTKSYSGEAFLKLPQFQELLKCVKNEKPFTFEAKNVSFDTDGTIIRVNNSPILHTRRLSRYEVLLLADCRELAKNQSSQAIMHFMQAVIVSLKSPNLCIRQGKFYYDNEPLEKNDMTTMAASIPVVRIPVMEAKPTKR